MTNDRYYPPKKEIILNVFGTIFIDFKSLFLYNFSRWFKMIDKYVVKIKEF